MLKELPAVITIAILLSWTAAAGAADVAAGRTAAQAKCVECHEADDWEGESAASLQGLIADIVASKVKHRKKIELSPAEIADIAAYWGQGGKQRSK